MNRPGEMTGAEEAPMRWSRFRGNDELVVAISLAMALGMLIGAAAAVWILPH